MDDKNIRACMGILTAAAVLFIVYVVVYILFIADTLLIPLVLAGLIWYLINTFDHMLSHVRIKDWRPPRWIRLLVALTAFVLIFNMVTGIIVSNVSQIIQDAPKYQESFQNMLHNLPFGIKIEEMPALNKMVEEFDLGLLLQKLAGLFTSLLGNVGLITIYLIFMFLEERYFANKLASTAGEERQRWVLKMLSRFDRDIKRYIGIKTFVSLATALGSWIIMRAVGLKFAEFWALLIFVLNFIPNLGSIVATILPSLLALLQFDGLAPFWIILIGIGALQLIIGNLLEPALMGKSLNVSPLVIIISLVFWGVVWGLPGLFLCVPITVILMIILSSFEKTRWIAQIMSRDGNFQN